VPRLLGPEQVAGAADLQVAHRDLEPRPSIENCSIALSRFCATSLTVRSREQQVAVRPVLVPPDPPAQLVQVGEPEPVGVVDEHRVRGRDVDARLDDRRRDEDVRLAAMNLSITRSSSRGSICPCPTTMRASGASAPDVARRRLDVVHAVVHEEDLPLARSSRSIAALDALVRL
jgi:hypothetical protein